MLQVLILALAYGQPGVGVSQRAHCSLKVWVSTTNGLPIGQGRLMVTELSGRVQSAILEDLEAPQIMSFCDLGVLPVKLQIESGPHCRRTTVEHVTLSGQGTQFVHLVHDPCNEPRPVPQQVQMCEVMIRLAGADKSRDVTVSVNSHVLLKPDRFGRVFSKIKQGEVANVSVSASSGQIARGSLSCGSPEITIDVNASAKDRDE